MTSFLEFLALSNWFNIDGKKTSMIDDTCIEPCDKKSPAKESLERDVSAEKVYGGEIAALYSGSTN